MDFLCLHFHDYEFPKKSIIAFYYPKKERKKEKIIAQILRWKIKISPIKTLRYIYSFYLNMFVLFQKPNFLKEFYLFSSLPYKKYKLLKLLLSKYIKKLEYEISK